MLGFYFSQALSLVTAIARPVSLTFALLMPQLNEVYFVLERAGVTVIRDIFLGFVKVHILYHASEAPVFGLELIEELGEHGYKISPGTLYPTLHRMEQQGLLASSEQLVNGKVRKYYSITTRGRATLREARIKIAELVHEVGIETV